MAVKAIPDGYYTLTPYLVVQGASEAIEFYQKALGAKELLSMPGPDGAVMHAELQVGTSRLMLAEENPQMGTKSPKTVGGSPVSVFIYTENVDALVKQAAAAGATVTMPAADQFWGDRMGAFEDPFGHQWSVATHIEDVPEEEMANRMKAAFA